MGANGSFNKEVGGIPAASRTHFETGHKIDGHKVIVQKECPRQVKVPMNSNSESPVYLCAKEQRDRMGNKWYEIKSIGVYKDNKCVGQIDLKFDSNGNVIPYSDTEKGSHYHILSERDGIVGRKSHDAHNYLPIPAIYRSLISKIELFNKSKKK